MELTVARLWPRFFSKNSIFINVKKIEKIYIRIRIRKNHIIHLK